MFSLIVCTVDRFDQLERLFVSLKAQTFRRFEVVLVDQNPDDRLAVLIQTFVSSYPIRHIRSPKGLSRARNAGIAVATGTFVAFPDDDCWYENDTLADADRLFAQFPDVAIVTGRTLDSTGLPSVSPTGEVPLTIGRHNYLACGNSNGIFVRRAALAATVGFDEDLGVGSESPFQSGEEADFLLRSIAAGQELRYFPSLIVHHDQVVTGYDIGQVGRARRYGRGFGALMRKQRFSVFYVAYRLMRPFISWLIALLRFDKAARDYKWAWFSGIAEGYVTWPRWRSRQDARSAAIR